MTVSRTGDPAMTGHRTVLITGGYVATMDPDVGDVPTGDVLIVDGQILDVGVGLKAPSAEIVDAAGHLVLPGLVDTHRHAWLGAGFAGVSDVDLSGYSARVMGAWAPRFSPEDVYASTLWGALQALNAGVTTIADWAHNLTTPEHTDAGIKALTASGVRGVFLYGGPAHPTPTQEVVPAYSREVHRLRDGVFHSGRHGLLRLGLALRGPYAATPEAIRAEFALARNLALPISIHAGMAGYPGAVRQLADLGLLGDDVNYAHGNQFTDAELGLIAVSGGSLSASPSVEMSMALGTFPILGRARHHRIAVGLAADTVASSGTDLFSEMRLALAAERARAYATAVADDMAVHGVAVSHRDVAHIATLGGAQTWRLDDEVGSLSPGKRGDVITIDLRRPHLNGAGDPVFAMLLGAGPADVSTVVVDGQILKRDGRLLGAVAASAERLLAEVRQRVGTP